MSPNPTKHDVAVYIGRFQIFHNGQLALLRRALEAAPLCIVVIGSAYQARTPKNPFTWQERVEMIRLAMPEADRDRIQFLPVRDYYNQDRWVTAVKQGVAQLACGKMGASLVLVGHFKDATSEYLRNFPDWTLDAVESQGRIDASALRDCYFGHAVNALEPALAALVNQIPATTAAFLRTWAALPYFHELAQEWESLKKEKAKWAGSPYAPVFVTVDAVVKCNDRVLLIKRGRSPGKGLFAVPGGFIEQRETVYQSALRELEEETHMRLLESDMRHALKVVHVFDHPDRSLRGRVITHAHFFDIGSRSLPEVQAADDAASAEWVPIEKLASMEERFHDDHFHMLDFFFSLTTQPE
jgi:bifunctional NMN adenylyltransferase/nudix hydrolase